MPVHPFWHYEIAIYFTNNGYDNVTTESSPVSQGINVFQSIALFFSRPEVEQVLFEAMAGISEFEPTQPWVEHELKGKEVFFKPLNPQIVPPF